MLLDGTSAESIQRAAQRLAQGELVAFPTETVYGLGARADSDAAVAKIFSAKGRPSDHPLIVHVVDGAAALAFTPRVPETAQKLMQAYWPGPLTLVLDRRSEMGAAAAGGQGSIGVRCPAHPVAQALLRAAFELGLPGVAAPSANRFGRISPTTAAHVVADFDPGLWVLDGGPCDVGIESTIVDCRPRQPVLLRPGQINRTQIEALLEQPLGVRDALSPRVSGNLAAHYAPQAPLRLMTAPMMGQALAVLLGDMSPAVSPVPLKLAVYSRHPPARPGPGMLVHRMPNAPDAAAHELFAVLRSFDEQGAQLIWVEEPPDAPEWEGVRDRLLRAAAS
jgi:L-threonylcarbamoyladenylate synthase